MQGDKAQPVPNPFGGVTDPKLLHLLEMAKVLVDALTPEERAAMLRQQAEGWARSEAQWAEDFRAGRCNSD